MFCKLAKLFRRGISLCDYPRYGADLYLRWIFPSLLRRRGVDVGEQIVWYGKPILSRAEGSVLRIGGNCRICSRSSDTALGVSHPVVLRTLASGSVLQIGAGVRMSGVTICAKSSVVIGNRVVIGAGVTIADTDFHSLDPVVRSSPQDAKEARFKAVEIGNDVFIGGGSYVLKGSRIGNAAVIGAGSVVTGIVPPYAIYAGNPARQVGTVAAKG